jgi:hypothetical protein
MSVMKKALVGLVLAIAVAGCANAAEPPAFAKLRAKFASGIPWTVSVYDPAGKELASLRMRITRTPADSCLGDMAGGLRVEFDPTQAKAISPSLPIGSYGVAKLTDDAVKIDLTGGICDAYLMMAGKIAADGSSTGTVYRFSIGGGDDVGTYRATVR